jgi:hypothetical protein
MIFTLILVDLKIGDLTHQDIDQMQMYVNYYTRRTVSASIPLSRECQQLPIHCWRSQLYHRRLCRHRSRPCRPLPEDNEQIFAAKYLPYMPTKEELSRELNLGDYEKIGE